MLRLSKFGPIEKFVGIVGSLASIVGLLFFFLPSEQTHSQGQGISVDGGDFIGGNKIENIEGDYVKGDKIGRDKNVYMGQKPGYFVVDKTLVAFTESPPSFSDFENALRRNQFVYGGTQVEFDEDAQAVQDKKLPISYVKVKFLDGELEGKHGWISRSQIKKR